MVQNDFDNIDSYKNNEMMIIVLTLGALSVQHDLENADLDYSPMRMLSRVNIHTHIMCMERNTENRVRERERERRKSEKRIEKNNKVEAKTI